MPHPTRIALVHFEFFLPEAHSLKEKRMFLRRLKDVLGRKFNASVAEVDHQDLWQRAVLAVAMVAAEQGFLESMVGQLVEEAEVLAPSELVRHEVEYL